MVEIVYWEDPRAGSPAGRLIRWLRQVWPRVRARLPRPELPSPAAGPDERQGESSTHSWVPEPDSPPLRLIQLEPAAGTARHLCPSGPRARSRASRRGSGTAHVVYENGGWWARHPDGEIEITHCPYCGRELPDRVPDPHQLRLELRQ